MALLAWEAVYAFRKNETNEINEMSRTLFSTASFRGQVLTLQAADVVDDKLSKTHKPKVALNARHVDKERNADPIQEVMSSFALQAPPKTGVFLFEDHKIARASFLLQDCCRKVSTRAFLQFPEQKNWIPSAVEVERRAITAGRQFSQIRFPPS